MIKNNIKIAVRNLFRHKTYSAINIFGLGLGIATGFIMLLWVNNEFSMNKYHRNADRIYEVNAKLKFGTDEVIWERTPGPLYNYAKDNLSDIERVTRVKSDYGNNQVIKYNNKIFLENNIGYADNDFFSIFDFPIVEGDPAAPLAQGLSVVLPESTAKKYFGSEDPVGKVIKFRDTTFQGSAVMKDFPANSSIKFGMLFSMDIVKLKFRGNGEWKTIDEDWGNYNYSTFCLMREGAGTRVASAAFLNQLRKANPAAGIEQFLFRPLKNIYLYKTDGSKGRMIMVEIFFIVAIFVLLIAAINYINLVTARATQRVKEISVRKIIGAEKGQLFWQFFTETGVLLLMATLASFIFAQLLLPVYREVSGDNISFDLSDWRLWKLLLVLLGSIWLLTGLYPALLLSSFKPLQSLKGRGFLSNAGTLRKSLVVLQFVVSITLLLGTVFIHRQMNYVQQKELNLDADNVLVFPVWKIYKNTDEFKNRLQQQSGVTAITTSSLSLFEGANTTTDITWPGQQTDQEMWIAQFYVDKNFPTFFHTQFTAGKGFENTSPDANEFILNETAVKKMGLKNPVGQAITFHKKPGIIIGVVKDFYYESFHTELGPAILQYVPDEMTCLYARVQQSDSKKVIAAALGVWKKYEPNLPMGYAYLNETIAKQYDKETRASKLFDVFAIITMLISCLGLYGLATHSAERRVKEIGIRKVLGAELSQIAALLSKEFIVLILVAICIAIPIVWIGMDKLLVYFAYHISLQWWVFAIACIAAITIAMVTISFRAFKAATANPVKSLRTE